MYAHMHCRTERYLPKIFVFINFVVPYFISMLNNLDKMCMVTHCRKIWGKKTVHVHTLKFDDVQNIFINLHIPFLFAKSFLVYREKQIIFIIYQY